MTHYELLGLRPEATDAEVRDAIAAARASWSRRRDASATPAALERATAALARLDEAARDLGSPEARRAYDEAFLPPAVLHRVRTLRGYPDYPLQKDAGAESPSRPTANSTAVVGAPPASRSETGDRTHLVSGQAILAEAEQEICTETQRAIRAEAEQAIRAEAERRREAQRQEEERAALERTANATLMDADHDALARELDPGSANWQMGTTSGTPSARSSGTRAGRKARQRGRAARVGVQKGRKGSPDGRIAGHLDIDWRAVSILALATAAGIGIALVPVALVTSGRTGAILLFEAASDSESPRVLPVTNVSATISQPSGNSLASDPTVALPLASATPASQAALTAQSASTAIRGQVPPAAAGPAGTAIRGQVPPAAAGPDGTAIRGQASSSSGHGPQTAGSPPPAATHRAQATPPAVLAPGEARDLLRRAYAAYSSGNYPQSLRLYDELLARTPREPIVHVARALTLLAMSRPRDAEHECRSAIAIQPTMPEAHFNLGVALHRQNRDDEAVQAFRRFVELAPEDRAAPQARGFIARWNLTMHASASRRPGR